MIACAIVGVAGSPARLSPRVRITAKEIAINLFITLIPLIMVKIVYVICEYSSGIGILLIHLSVVDLNHLTNLKLSSIILIIYLKLTAMMT